jgi:hypothetical protein
VSVAAKWLVGFDSDVEVEADDELRMLGVSTGVHQTFFDAVAAER